MISKKKGISIAIIIIIAAMFVSSSVIVNPLLAKTGHKEKTNSLQKSYKDFQKCITGAAGTKGYASKLEIRDCFNPIYSLSNTNQSNSNPANSNPANSNPANSNPANSNPNPSGIDSSQTNPANSNPSGIDFSSPQSMNH
jgi:hypothetical protein